MPGTKQLMAAIQSEPIWKVEKLLKKMDLDEINGKHKGETALHLACRGNYNEAVDLLVDKKGVDVNAKNKIGETPLHVAVANNNGLAVTKILSHPQVDVNVKDNTGFTPLHVALLFGSPGHQILLELLAIPGIDVHVKDNNGWTALHYACGHNNHQMVSELLGCPGVDVNVKDRYGVTPVMVSARECREETLKLLLEDSRVNLDAKNDYGGGLEEEVGRLGGDSRTKQKCLQMIGDERRKREHKKVVKVQQSQGANVGQRIKKVDTFNKEMGDFEDKWKNSLDIGNVDGNGEEKGEGILVTTNEEFMEGNGREVKEEGRKGKVNEDIMKRNEGERRKEGSVASVNDPKEKNKNDKEIDYKLLCWSCSKEDCKLYKCGGCRRARYCSDECIVKDWEVHGSWCKKEQKRRNEMKAKDQKTERELKSPLDLE